MLRRDCKLQPQGVGLETPVYGESRQDGSGLEWEKCGVGARLPFHVGFPLHVLISSSDAAKSDLTEISPTSRLPLAVLFQFKKESWILIYSSVNSATCAVNVAF